MPCGRHLCHSRSKTSISGSISALIPRAWDAPTQAAWWAPGLPPANVQAVGRAGRAGRRQGRPPEGMQGPLGQPWGGTAWPCPALPPSWKPSGRRRLRFGLPTSAASYPAAWASAWAPPSHTLQPRAHLCSHFASSLPSPLPPSYLPYSAVHHLPSIKHLAGADKWHI